MGRVVHPHFITPDSALGGSTIVRSVMLDGVNDYFTRTPSVNGNRQKFTFSLWVKRGNVAVDDNHFMRSASWETAFRFDSSDRLHFYFQDESYTFTHLYSSARFRDIGAWYHCVAVVDTTHATTSSRVKLYVNGEQITTFDTATYPRRYIYSGFNLASNAHTLGGKPTGTNERLNGYLAEVHFIDGQALDPSYFGYTEPQTRIWRPKKYSGNHANVNTNAVNDGSTWASNANYFNKERVDDNASGGAAVFTGLNASLTVNFSTPVPVSSSLVLNLYSSVGNFNNHSDIYINDVERTITVEDAYGGSNSGDFAVDFTGNMTKLHLNAKNSANNGLGMIIVDGEILTNGYNARGNNSFYLPFTDNSGTTATTIGRDHSGNGNNFTPTSIATSDSVIDTPTDNFCTLNPLDNGVTNTSHLVYSNGNLRVKAASGVWASTRGTFAVSSGKWYWEVKILSAASLRPFIGVIQKDVRLASNQADQTHELGVAATSIAYWVGSPIIRGGANTSGSSTNVPSCTTNDIVGVALDMDNKKVYFSKNGTFFASQDPANNSGEIIAFSTSMQNAPIAPAIQAYNNSDEGEFNFGQRPFSYTPPTGYRELTSNRILKHNTTSILDPKKHFEVLTWSGTDHNYRDITGLDFTPDFVWIKNRSDTDWHILSNTIVGMQCLNYSNSTSQLNHELNANGFINKSIRGENGQGGISVNGQGGGNTNELNENYVAWCWKGGSPNIETPTSGSVFFSKDNNYLDLGSYTDFQFGTGDYTIEMFVYHIDLGGQQTYVSDAYGNSAGVYFYKDSNQKIGMYYSGQIATSNTNIDSNKWVHIAASRSSGTLKLFQDGIEVGSGSDSTNLTSTQLNIGDSNGGSSGCMHGYISNVRVLKGTGLYTSNFTVPTSPLTNITNTKFLGCQSETVAGLASVHPSPFSNNGTNYSSGSQLDGALTVIEGTYSHGGPAGLFDGRIGQYGSDTYASSTLSNDNYIQWTPTSAISYTSKVEVWCYAANGYNITNYYSLNGASEQTFTGGGSNFNNQNWITITTGSGTLTSLKIRLTRSGAQSFVNWGAIRVDGCILVNDVTGKVVTPTMDDTHSVPPSPKNPFDGEFAIDGTRYLTAAAAGLNGGTITPIASSINTKAGFSMLMYKGNGTAGASISHGLREAPKIFFIKSLDADRNWYTITTAKDGTVDYFYLNLTNALGNSAASAPTSNLIYYTASQESNTNGENYILYAFHDVPGYCKIGSYTGNGSGNGPYVELGFDPAFIMMKEATDASTNWVLYDNKRDPNNPVDLNLYPNLSNAEGDASLDYDFLSNGFKVRTANGGINASGDVYLYMAFAEKSGNTPYQTETTAR